MGSNVDQDNYFPIGFPVSFERENETTIILYRTSPKGSEFTLQFMCVQLWLERVFRKPLKSFKDPLFEKRIPLGEFLEGPGKTIVPNKDALHSSRYFRKSATLPR